LLGWFYLISLVRFLDIIIRRTISTENYASTHSLLATSIAMLMLPTIFFVAFGLVLYNMRGLD
jgi:hypothetical protein